MTPFKIHVNLWSACSQLCIDEHFSKCLHLESLFNGARGHISAKTIYHHYFDQLNLVGGDLFCSTGLNRVSLIVSLFT